MTEKEAGKIATVLDETIKTRRINCLAGWVGNNSHVLTALSKLCPLVGRWPFCQYFNVFPKLGSHGSKMQWIFVNCEHREISHQDPFTAPSTKLWDTALAATYHVWEELQQHHNHKQCPECKKPMGGFHGIFRHMYPRSTCMDSWVHAKILEWGKKSSFNPDTALAELSRKELMHSFLPLGEVACFHRLTDEAIENWQKEAIKKNQCVMTGRQLYIGNIRDTCLNFNEFLPCKAGKDDKQALQMLPQQYGHLIFFGNGTPSKRSQAIQKHQAETTPDWAIPKRGAYGKRKQFHRDFGWKKEYNTQKARRDWQAKCQYDTGR